MTEVSRNSITCFKCLGFLEGFQVLHSRTSFLLPLHTGHNAQHPQIYGDSKTLLQISSDLLTGLTINGELGDGSGSPCMWVPFKTAGAPQTVSHFHFHYEKESNVFYNSAAFLQSATEPSEGIPSRRCQRRPRIPWLTKTDWGRFMFCLMVKVLFHHTDGHLVWKREMDVLPYLHTPIPVWFRDVRAEVKE